MLLIKDDEVGLNLLYSNGWKRMDGESKDFNSNYVYLCYSFDKAKYIIVDKGEYEKLERAIIMYYGNATSLYLLIKTGIVYLENKDEV